MINSMSVSICNRFYAVRANSGKISTFQRVPSISCLRLKKTSSPRDTNFCHDKLESLWQSTVQATVRNSVILGVTVLIQCQGVTDGQTDRQTLRR